MQELGHKQKKPRKINRLSIISGVWLMFQTSIFRYERCMSWK